MCHERYSLCGWMVLLVYNSANFCQFWSIAPWLKRCHRVPKILIGQKRTSTNTNGRLGLWPPVQKKAQFQDCVSSITTHTRTLSGYWAVLVIDIIFCLDVLLSKMPKLGRGLTHSALTLNIEHLKNDMKVIAWIWSRVDGLKVSLQLSTTCSPAYSNNDLLVCNLCSAIIFRF